MMSDWVATYDAVGAANGGLDLEMPKGKYMNTEDLLPAIRDGRVKEATIDEKVRHILTTAARFGWLDVSRPIPRSRNITRRIIWSFLRARAKVLSCSRTKVLYSLSRRKRSRAFSSSVRMLGRRSQLLEAAVRQFRSQPSAFLKASEHTLAHPRRFTTSAACLR